MGTNEVGFRRYRGMELKLVDLTCLSYLALIGGGILLFRNRVPHWLLLVALHGLSIVLILEVVRLHQMSRSNRWLFFLRIGYVLLVYMLAWNEMNETVVMLFGSHWATELFVKMDQTLFGIHPTVWVQQFYQPALDEIMNLFYAGYYLFGPLAIWPLFRQNQQEKILAILGIVAFTFCTNFLLFYLLPALGPRHIPFLEALRTADYTGYILGPFTRYVQSRGSVRGACFPSSHISGALSWGLAALRYNPGPGKIMVLFVGGIMVSTVYLGYHHAVDPLAGALWGILASLVAIWLLKKRNEDPALTK